MSKMTKDNIPKAEDIQLEIGLIIGEYRAMKGMPPKKLADKLNISEKDLNKIENGNIEEIINREKSKESGWRENKRASGADILSTLRRRRMDKKLRNFK